MPFNVEKCNIGSKYFTYQSELAVTTEEKDLGVIITDDLMVEKHCLSAYCKANKILGMIQRTFRSRDSHLLLSLYN